MYHFWTSRQSRQLDFISGKVTLIMATLDSLSAAADTLVAEVGAGVAALNDLAAKVAAGETIQQADIDAISAKLQAATDSLSTAVTTDDPAPAAPPAGV